MIDIVERLRDQKYFHCNVGPEAADEIEALRQRVKELEAENQLAWNTCEKAETREAELSLAALKAGQGEMVGYFVNVNSQCVRPNYQQVTDDCAGDSDVVALYIAPKPGKPA